MAELIGVPCFSDRRGDLFVLEKVLPFAIKRVYYITGVPGFSRGGHRHKKSTQALICVHGSCLIYNNNGTEEEEFLLDAPTKCLILDPEDWHEMRNFSSDSILLVLASTAYDVNDYIDEPYE